MKKLFHHIILTGIYLTFILTLSLRANSQTSHFFQTLIESGIIYPEFTIRHVNDFNPVLRQKSNDTGYTLGSLVGLVLVDRDHSIINEFKIQSDLYTAYLPDSTFYTDNGRLIRTQKFNELSSFDYRCTWMPKNSRWMFSTEFSIGIRNRKKPIPGMTLFQQGGMSGRGGYHGYIDFLPWISNPGQENIPTGGISLYGNLTPVLKRYFLLSRGQGRESSWILAEAGAHLSTWKEYNYLFVNTCFDFSLYQTCKLFNQKMKLSLTGAGKVEYFNGDGMVASSQLGLKLRYWRIDAGYTSLFFIGKQPLLVTGYSDNESMMKVDISFRL